MSSALCVFFSPRPDECDGAATDHTSVYSRAHRVRPESTKEIHKTFDKFPSFNSLMSACSTGTNGVNYEVKLTDTVI